MGNRKSEVGSRKSEVGSGKSEVGNRKSKVRSRKSEVGSRKSEVRSGKWEVRRSSHSALRLNGQKSEIRSSHFVKSEVWSLSLKSEVGSRKSEVGSRKSEVRSRKTLLGFRREREYYFWVDSPGGGNPLFDPNGYVSLNRVWFSVSWDLPKMKQKVINSLRTHQMQSIQSHKKLQF